jgi:hypothetical protein
MGRILVRAMPVAGTTRGCDPQSSRRVIAMTRRRCIRGVPPMLRSSVALAGTATWRHRRAVTAHPENVIFGHPRERPPLGVEKRIAHHFRLVAILGRPEGRPP